MLKTSSTVLVRPLCRLFNTNGNVLCSESKIMAKVMRAGKKPRKHNYVEAPLISSSNVTKSVLKDGPKSINLKRIKVLNKLFMENISDLMATGMYSEQFLGYGIQIIRVKISSDFNLVKVYWYSHLDKISDQLEVLLKKNAGYLRHELTQLRIMGNVPRIEFVRDVQYVVLSHLDEKLRVADYGEDHVPVTPISKLKSDIELEMKLDERTKEMIKKVEEHDPLDLSVDNLPQMPQNVFGLNHADIMNRVMKSLHKSRALHRLVPDSNDSGTPALLNVNPDPVKYGSAKGEREALKKFLLQRNQMKADAQKKADEDRLAREYLADMWEEEQQETQSKQEFDRFMKEQMDDEWHEESNK